MGSWPHDTVVDAEIPTVEVTPLPAAVVAHVVENTPFPATVIDRLTLARLGVAGPSHHHGGLAGQLKVLAAAALVLALACAYAFAVVGRDDAVGRAQSSAMTDPSRESPRRPIEPPLEVIPLGDPWFSAPPPAPAIERTPRSRPR